MYNTPNQIIRYVRCMRAMPAVFRRPSALAPVALLGGVELALCAAYLFYPSLGPAGAALVRVTAGQGALHYPEHVLGVPAVLDWIRFSAMVVLGAPVLASAVRRARWLLRPETDGVGATSRGGLLFVAVVLVALADLGIQRGVGLLAEVPIAGRFQPLWLICAAASRPFLWMMAARSALLLVSADEETGRVSLVRHTIAIRVDSLVVYGMLALTALVVVGPLDALVGATTAFVESGRPAMVSFAALLAVVVDIPVRLALVAFVVSMGGDRGGIA